MASSAAAVAEVEVATQSYKGFGSFHSDNVQDLIALPDAQYQSPAFPDFARDIPTPDGFDAPAIRSSHFSITNDFTFLNHGAFGGALRHAITMKRGFEDLMESQLLVFVDRKLLPWIVASIRALSRFLRCSPTDTVLVPNATYGLNAAMSLIAADDVVAYLDTEYLSVYKMLWFRAQATGASLHEIPINTLFDRPEILSDDNKLTEYIEEHLPAGCTAIVLDHISSTSAMAFPVFTHLIPMLRRRGVEKIIVDGAHGPLQMDLDFNSLTEEQKPSIYVGNLHKWVSCPKSVGFMWVPKENQETIVPPVRSHGASEGFTSEFVWDGTRDYGASLTVPFVTEFWSRMGTTRVRDHCSILLTEAVDMLTKAWDVSKVPRRAPFMSLVRLPDALNRGTKRPTAKFIQDTLHAKYHIEVPCKTINGAVYVRLSSFIYNSMPEYERLRDAVNDLASQWRKRSSEARDEGEGEPCPDRESGGCGLSGLAAPPKRKTRGF